MIPWKRTLGWALCWAVASTAVSAEEPAADAAMPDDIEMAEPAAAAMEPEEPIGDPVAPEAEAAAMDTAADPAAGDELAMPADMPAAPGAEAAEAMPEAPAEPAAPALGAVGYDAEGRPGRIHVVVSGDTLWDISNAYLGTPWVWPSIWKDNGDIPNPHLIHPGDRIWITPSEMRRITAEEADRMVANVPAAPAEEPAPAAMEDAAPGLEAAAPVAEIIKISGHEMTGLISPEAYRSAASVVGSTVDRKMMSQEDGLYIGLGESEVQVGDEFTLFRTNQKVLDPDTGSVLGYHVDFLGWVRVEETFPESSLASIRMSTGEIEEGDRVMPREPLPKEIEIQPTPENVEGKITFFPGRRVLLGFADFVYLNRGKLDGLQVGSPLEVYRPGYLAPEVSRDELVEVPDRVIASMLVVRAEEQTAVAMVTSTQTELELGDRFRGASTP